MTFHSLESTRREFVAGGIGALAAWAVPHGKSIAGDETQRIAFFVLGDTHYLANKESPGRMDAASADVCGRLVDTLNALPGAKIPDEAGGGSVAVPSGVIHVGDVIDTGDKNGGVTAKMQQSEWDAFAEDYGLTGKDGRLRCPVYEIHGNHDSPHGKGLAIDKIIQRNRNRPAVTNISENGVHYSWDWGGVHFVNLGLIVGTDKRVTRKRRYAALDSLDFLVSDLRTRVGESGRPVILSHHVDIGRYTGACDPAAAADSKEWDSCDVAAFYEALRGYHVAAIFYGHTHGRNVFQWDGLSTKAKTGVHVFNTDNASHFHSDAQAMFYVEITDNRLIVREYQTKDRWQTGFFTPLSWTVPLAA